RPATDDAVEIDLRRPGVAAALAWLLPGLGHIYQGRIGKGILFFVCVFGTFCYGMLLGNGKVVYAATPEVLSREFLQRWQYACQIGIGMPAMPAYLQVLHDPTGRDPLWNGFMAPPQKGLISATDDSGNISEQPDEAAKWTVDWHPDYEVGTVYTVIAGLLNLLVICDAYAGPLVLGHGKGKEDSPDDEGEGSDGDDSAGSSKRAKKQKKAKAGGKTS
ncbi:hypothetical protein OAS39_09915, partial [Pirellulales bacterium]|nr:hypothetical protein [Pirellulales bacterium]